MLGVAAGVAAQWLLAASLAPSASKAVETPSVVRIRVAQAPRDLVKRNSAPAGVLPLNVKKPVPAPPRRNRTPQFSAGVSAPPTPPLDASAPLPPVALVTSRYHLARCQLLARRLGFATSVPIAAEPRLRLTPRALRLLLLESAYLMWIDLGVRWATLIGHTRMASRIG